MNKLIVTLVFFAFFTMPAALFAAEFTKTGTIKRTLSADEKYGNCMISLTVPIENACPNAWVSLDCKGTYVSSEAGERNYASAMMAAMLKKPVMIVIDNEKKHDNFCVVTRIDIILN